MGNRDLGLSAEPKMTTDDERHLEYKNNFQRLQVILDDHPATVGLQANTSMRALAGNIDAIRQKVPCRGLASILTLFHGLCVYRQYLDNYKLLRRMLDQHGMVGALSTNTTFGSITHHLDNLSTRGINVRHIRSIYDMVRAYRSEWSVV